LIAAMIGSRVLFIIVNWGSEYSADPLKIFRIWEGGLVFYGGLLGAVAFSIYYSLKRGWDFFYVADVLIPSVALGQFFGRLGCFAAGCCWGDPCDASYAAAVQFPKGSLAYSSMQRTGEIGAADTHTIHVHPVQLYESLGTLSIFLILMLIRGKKRFHGQLLLIYAFLYPILRSTLELFRGDKERGVYNVFGLVELSTSQIISIGVATAAITTLFVLLGRKMRSDTVPA
jgi:phosphatidylglycerol:prolipoprotein diacylglycerol transferase